MARFVQQAITNANDRPGPNRWLTSVGEKFFAAFTAAELTFFIADLLISLALRARR